MKTTATCLATVVAVSIAALVAQGQESASAPRKSSAHERLDPLAWQIGDWIAEYQASADSGPIKKGDTVTTRFSLHWSPDRTFMVNNSSADVNGKKIATGLEVISWNDEKSVVSHSYFGTWGTGHGTWTKVGDTAELDWSIEGPYGTFQAKSYVSKGPDSWTWQIREQTHDGETMPDMPLATFRPKTGAPAGDLWNAYQKAAAGKWVAEGQLLWDIPRYHVSAGDAFDVELSIDTETHGNVLTGNQDFHVKAKSLDLQTQVVAGWDPDSGQIRLFAYWSDGFVEKLFLTRRQGSTFFGTYTATAPGFPTDRWPISLQFSDLDSYVYKFVGGPHKGKVLSSWKRQ